MLMPRLHKLTTTAAGNTSKAQTMSDREIELLGAGFILGPLTIITIYLLVVLLNGIVGMLRERGTTLTCRCGQEFGEFPCQTFLYLEDGVPVYEDGKGTLDWVTRLKARFHRRFKCPGEVSE